MYHLFANANISIFLFSDPNVQILLEFSLYIGNFLNNKQTCKILKTYENCDKIY